MSISEIITGAQNKFTELAAHERYAIETAWRNWESSPLELASIWGQVPQLIENRQKPPIHISHLDWWRLAEANNVSKERRARWAWHDATSELIGMLPPSHAHDTASVHACDAFNTTVEEHAILASSVACDTVIQAVGQPAARVLCEMIYENTRPSNALMWQATQSVLTLEFNGRVYVL